MSHVLRGRNEEFRIGADTAARIQRAAPEMGYRPSALARNFKDHRAYSLCLADQRPHQSLLGRPGHGRTEGRPKARATRWWSSEHRRYRGEGARSSSILLRDRRVDGLILSPAHHRPRHLAELKAERLPFVFVDRTIDEHERQPLAVSSAACPRPWPLGECQTVDAPKSRSKSTSARSFSSVSPVLLTTSV